MRLVSTADDRRCVLRHHTDTSIYGSYIVAINSRSSRSCKIEWKQEYTYIAKWYVRAWWWFTRIIGIWTITAKSYTICWQKMQISVGCCVQNAPQVEGILYVVVCCSQGTRPLFSLSLLYKLTELKYIHKSVDVKVFLYKICTSKRKFNILYKFECALWPLYKEID